MFKYTARKPFQANFRPGEQPGRNGHGAPPIQELGALLRERREAVGATLAEVETATRIRQKYLAALESDEWQLLPGEVIGRGFLRNYATYLGLDSTEAVERRRAVADPSLAGALSDISAGAPLPPLRKVDYRPKDVAIREEPEGIERRELRLTPILTVVALFGLLWTIWWGFNAFGDRVGAGVSGMMDGAQTRIAVARTTNAPTWTPAPTLVDNGGQAAVAPAGGDNNGINSTPVVADVGSASDNPVIVAAATPITPTLAEQVVLVPTDTPLPPPTPPVTNTPEPPPTATNTPEPTPTPTETPPVETPTETPTETPVPAPVVIAPACPDSRAVISAPGENQTLAGVINISGRAVHEAFQNYKLEYAAAGGGFNYFAGTNSQVDGGVLGTLDTSALPNGAYTIQLTVVDLTGNFPPPCPVNVVIQN